MSIPFAFSLRQITKEIRLDTLSKDEDPMMVWWPAAINKMAHGTQPSVVVAFRKIIDGTLSDVVTHRSVLLTAMGQLRTGTVWQNGQCISEVQYEEELFDVDFSPRGWRLTSFEEAFQEREQSPFPQNIYPLKYDRDKSRLLQFHLSNGGKLIVPCLEFFSRCYGRSAEVKRVIATYPWEETTDTGKSRLFSPLGEPEEEGKWKVKLRRRLVNNDVVLLAHAKYDPYSQSAVKRIYAEIESQHQVSADKRTPLFINIQPWFDGEAKILVKGIRFDNGKSFLALQIAGCSDPTGEMIYRGRENANNADAPCDISDQGKAWDGVPTKGKIKRPQIFDITSESDPNFDATPVEVYDDNFVVIGEEREVIDVRKEKAQSSSGVKIAGEEAENYSTGEQYGDNGKTGYASIVAPQVMSSEGMLRDMWNAMLRFKDEYPSIKSVEWYTPETGYCSDTEIRLISLKKIPECVEGIDAKTRNWVFSNDRERTRGVLVARIMVDNIPVHILEIERRTSSSGNEESYKGLVFVSSPLESLVKDLNKLLDGICKEAGKVTNVAYLCPGKGQSFKHPTSKTEQHLCDAALKNAFDKVGIKF